MSVIQWGQSGERLYETGTSKGVLFVKNLAGGYENGVPWNGLTAVTQSPSGAESTKQYADNGVYLNLVSAEDYSATIESFMYPDAFQKCIGGAQPSPGVVVSQQRRFGFGFSWQTIIGNDVAGNDFGYKIHLVWNAQASVSEKAHTTVNESPEAVTFSHELTTTPEAVVGITPALRPTAHIEIDSTKVPSVNLKALEDIIYGTAGTEPRMPTPAEVITIFAGTITEVTPASPTFVPATGVITIVPTTGVTYRRTDTNAVVASTMTIPTAGQSVVIKAYPNAGYKIAANKDDDWSFTRS